MTKSLLSVSLLFLFAGCGSVDDNRHEVDVKSEIAIQNQLESIEDEKNVDTSVDKKTLNSVQENLISQDSSDKEENALTQGLEYTSNQGGFE